MRSECKYLSLVRDVSNTQWTRPWSYALTKIVVVPVIDIGIPYGHITWRRHADGVKVSDQSAVPGLMPSAQQMMNFISLHKSSMEGEARNKRYGNMCFA